MSTPAPRHPSVPASSQEGRLGDSAGAVLSFRTTAGWGNVPGNWAAPVSTNAATFEAWIRTTVKDPQTIILGSNSPGATPRISVGGDRIAVYWNTGGSAPGCTSADTTPVTDGRWHHIAVVFDQGAITFYKDGVATTDQLSVGSAQQAAGDLQLGAGFGATTGFVGQMYGVRVWSVTRTAQEIAQYRWAPLGPPTPGLTVAASFDQGQQEIVNQVGGGTGSVSDCKVVTTDLPAPAWALSFSGDPLGSVAMGNISGLSTTAATFECWMKMSTAAGVAGSTQALIRQGFSAPQLTYKGDDKLSVTWLGNECDSADTRPVSDGGWHHVAVVFDHGYVTLYKDGVATADSFQVPDGLPTGTALLIGNNDSGSSPSPFDGELYDVRVWNCARTALEVSSFRYATLQGSEPGLVALSGYRQDALLSRPYVVNLANGEPGTGTAAVVPIPQLPQSQAPSPVWTYELAGEAPVGPVLTSQGLLCTDNNADGAGSAFLRSVDLQTGQAGWSYDVRAQSDQSSIVVPSAVGVYGQTALIGVQTTDKSQVEVHAVDVATGAPAWAKPAVVADVYQIITRPVVQGADIYVGVMCDEGGMTPGVAWGDAATGATIFVRWAAPQNVDAMTTPVTDGENVYVGINADGTAQVFAIPSTADGSNDFTTWNTGLDAPVTADLTLGPSALFVPNGTTMLALDLDYPNFGSTLWYQRLSGSVNSQPVLLGSTLYAGCDDGTLYALDAATGTVQWQVDTRSPISTALVNEDGVLYFATSGDDAAGPAFWAVDANSGGNDVVSYPVPGAGTIAFDQGGLANGVAYFYGTPDTSGANLVYAVNMSAVIHEFAVNSKLIVENYDTSTSSPAGSDTSYRVTLTIRDENGMARPGQAVKLWSTGTLSVVNQGSPVTLAPDSPMWMETDTSGNLTMALSAYDNGQPGGGTGGSPNLACPPLFAWANFMAAGEAIVIYPDHESLTQLSNVQGTSASAAGAVQGSGTAAVPLDQAAGYDGSPLISSSYRDPGSLTAIAATVRNTVGSRTTTSVTASRLAGRHPAQKYVRPGGALPNVVYAPDAAASPARPYVPGADPVFTADLSSGKPVYAAGTYDPTRPASLQAAGAGDLGSIWHDIEDFKNNVIHGAEKVAKIAWKFTANAVTTVIHTAEAEYDLAISDLEDAVTAVAGFFKSVVDDIKKAIEWLSALFNFENILKNHTFIKNAISNPTDPANPGILDQMASWVGKQQNGGTDFTSALSGLNGQSAAIGQTAQGTAGQTVQSQQNGHNDPNAAYNTGGNNNANQCTWMHQKVTENAAGAPDGGFADVAGTSFDPTTMSQAFQNFVDSAEAILKRDFADLPGDIKTAIESLLDSFKDPKSMLSTALSDLMTTFQDLADDFVKFTQDIASDILSLIATLVEQVVIWLAEPVSIPFVSDLYHALTGDQLSLLDLTCLLAAVPATILVDVLTGSPVIQDAGLAGPDATVSPAARVRIGLGCAAFALGEFGCVLDTLFLGIESRSGRLPVPFNIFNRLDFAVDFAGYVLEMAAAYGWSQWQAQDWVFWIAQAIPQGLNFAYQLRDDGTNMMQAGRDIVTGIAFMIVSAEYAHLFPASYKDAPNAPGLVLSANVFSNASMISELILTLLGPDAMLAQWVVKLGWFTIGNALGFAANVLGVLDS
jgi:outer membrane protein assembly factor BamB